MQVKLSGAGKWPYFTSAYRNALFQTIPNFVRFTLCEQIKRSKKLSLLAELIWNCLVGNLTLERRNANHCLFLSSSRYIRLLVFLQLSGDKSNS